MQIRKVAICNKCDWRGVKFNLKLSISRAGDEERDTRISVISTNLEHPGIQGESSTKHIKNTVCSWFYFVTLSILEASDFFLSFFLKANVKCNFFVLYKMESCFLFSIFISVKVSLLWTSEPPATDNWDNLSQDTDSKTQRVFTCLLLFNYPVLWVSQTLSSQTHVVMPGLSSSHSHRNTEPQ